jgi:hypothetical protein
MWTICGDLDAFYLEHRRCGELESDITDGQVWMTCAFGATMTRLLFAGPVA